MAGLKKKSHGGTWGVLAEFESPAAVYHAAEQVRDAGYSKWDVYAPIPIHGMDEAMGLKGSKMAWIVGTFAAMGASGGFLLQWWTSAVAYPIVVNDKPFGAWEQFTPVTFELGVLFAGISAVFGMLAINGLPRWNHPLFSSERFLSASDDGFFIGIESKDAKFNSDATSKLLEKAGGFNIEMVEDQ